MPSKALLTLWFSRTTTSSFDGRPNWVFDVVGPLTLDEPADELARAPDELPAQPARTTAAVTTRAIAGAA